VRVLALGFEIGLLCLLVTSLWVLLQHWVQATVAILTIAPQPRVTPPQAAYYAACMVAAEQTYGVPWSRLAAIIQHESQWRTTLISRTNDYGLGQHHCPSFFCARRPKGLERSALLEPCSNIQLTAEELARKRFACRRRHCGNYVKLYNPGNPTYAAQIARWEAKFKRAAHRATGPRVAFREASAAGAAGAAAAP